IKNVTNQVNTSIKGARGLRIAQKLHLLEESRRKRDARRAQLDLLFIHVMIEAMKPADDYEDPRDMKEIQLAKETIGDYKLKSATNYVIPEKNLETNKQTEQTNVTIATTIKKPSNKILSFTECIPPEERCHWKEPEIIKEFRNLNTIDCNDETDTIDVIWFPLHCLASDHYNLTILNNSNQKYSLLKPSLHNIFDEITMLPSLEMEYEEQKCIKAIYYRNHLLQLASRLVRCFDREIHSFRHQRYQLGVLLKRSELYQCTLYNEYCSEDESEESSSSSSSSDDDDSSYEEIDDENEDVVIMDLDTCPPGCPMEDFERTCLIREKRLDVEEEMTEEKKTLDILRKDLDIFTKKQRVVETTLKQAQNELEAFQLEKQRKLNELEIVVLGL
ncbi:uncharacterized protein DC041_0008609, partial [Schistosoma bovis]